MMSRPSRSEDDGAKMEPASQMTVEMICHILGYFSSPTVDLPSPQRGPSRSAIFDGEEGEAHDSEAADTAQVLPESRHFSGALSSRRCGRIEGVDWTPMLPPLAFIAAHPVVRRRLQYTSCSVRDRYTSPSADTTSVPLPSIHRWSSEAMDSSEDGNTATVAAAVDDNTTALTLPLLPCLAPLLGTMAPAENHQTPNHRRVHEAARVREESRVRRLASNGCRVGDVIITERLPRNLLSLECRRFAWGEDAKAEVSDRDLEEDMLAVIVDGKRGMPHVTPATTPSWSGDLAIKEGSVPVSLPSSSLAEQLSLSLWWMQRCHSTRQWISDVCETAAAPQSLKCVGLPPIAIFFIGVDATSISWCCQALGSAVHAIYVHGASVEIHKTGTLMRRGGDSRDKMRSPAGLLADAARCRTTCHQTPVNHADASTEVDEAGPRVARQRIPSMPVLPLPREQPLLYRNLKILYLNIGEAGMGDGVWCRHLLDAVAANLHHLVLIDRLPLGSVDRRGSVEVPTFFLPGNFISVADDHGAGPSTTDLFSATTAGSRHAVQVNPQGSTSAASANLRCLEIQTFSWLMHHCLLLRQAAPYRRGAAAAPFFGHLQVLNLSESDVTDLWCGALLNSLPILRELYLNWCVYLTDVAGVVQRLATRQLEVLSLIGLPQVRNESLRRIFADGPSAESGIANSLTELYLSCTLVTSVRCVGESCSKLRQLQLPDATLLTWSPSCTTLVVRGYEGLMTVLGQLYPSLLRLCITDFGSVRLEWAEDPISAMLPRGLIPRYDLVGVSASLPVLRELHLYRCRILSQLPGCGPLGFNGSILNVDRSVQDMRTLEWLLTPPTLQELSPSTLWQRPFLQELSLSYCSGLPSAQMVSLIAKHCPSLRVLRLSHTLLDTASLEVLCRGALAHTLRFLDLDACAALMDISPLLRCPRLTHLILMDGCHLQQRTAVVETDCGVHGLCEVVGRLCPHLRVFRLHSRGCMTPSDVAALRHLGRWVSEVDLSHVVGLDVTTMHALFADNPAFQHGVLRRINLSYTGMNNAMLRVLAKGMGNHLQELRLHGCHCVSDIRPLAESCSQLRVLKLSYTSVDAAGVFESLRHLHHLVDLDVRYCPRLRDLTDLVPLLTMTPLPYQTSEELSHGKLCGQPRTLNSCYAKSSLTPSARLAPRCRSSTAEVAEEMKQYSLPVRGTGPAPMSCLYLRTDADSSASTAVLAVDRESRKKRDGLQTSYPCHNVSPAHLHATKRRLQSSIPSAGTWSRRNSACLSYTSMRSCGGAARMPAGTNRTGRFGLILPSSLHSSIAASPSSISAIGRIYCDGEQQEEWCRTPAAKLGASTIAAPTQSRRVNSPAVVTPRVKRTPSTTASRLLFDRFAFGNNSQYVVSEHCIAPAATPCGPFSRAGRRLESSPQSSSWTGVPNAVGDTRESDVVILQEVLPGFFAVLSSMRPHTRVLMLLQPKSMDPKLWWEAAQWMPDLQVIVRDG